MKPHSKPFALYRHNQHGWEDGLWECVKRFKTMDQAMDSLRDLTRRRKETRMYVYVILPAEARSRFIIIKEEHVKQLLMIAK